MLSRIFFYQNPSKDIHFEEYPQCGSLPKSTYNYGLLLKASDL